MLRCGNDPIISNLPETVLMTDTFRAMCAELAEAYAGCIERYMTAPAEEDNLIDRARALLAQPEPEGLTDAADWDLVDDLGIIRGHGGNLHVSLDDRLDAIALFGRPTPQPVAEGPTVMEILELHSWLEDEWRANNDGEDLPTLDFARAVLAKWGRQ
jgi:hypothetical protein